MHTDQKTLELFELLPLFNRFKYLTSASIRNSMTSFRYVRWFGFINIIAKLRVSSNWSFVPEHLFLRQGFDNDKVFIFKMSEVGPASGVDLIKRMQVGGNLKKVLITFDHVKRVKTWTTLACHV